MHLLLRYTQALITQMAQTAVCNRHHSVDQQLCRWLLLSLDRLSGNELTHDAGADRQHARRAARRRHRGRRKTAGRAGLIRYSRGRITVLDRPGLESASASATRVVKKEFDRLLSDIPLGAPFVAIAKSR